eukprot:381919_1
MMLSLLGTFFVVFTKGDIFKADYVDELPPNMYDIYFKNDTLTIDDITNYLTASKHIDSISNHIESEFGFQKHHLANILSKCCDKKLYTVKEQADNVTISCPFDFVGDTFILNISINHHDFILNEELVTKGEQCPANYTSLVQQIIRMKKKIMTLEDHMSPTFLWIEMDENLQQMVDLKQPFLYYQPYESWMSQFEFTLDNQCKYMDKTAPIILELLEKNGFQIKARLVAKFNSQKKMCDYTSTNIDTPSNTIYTHLRFHVTMPDNPFNNVQLNPIASGYFLNGEKISPAAHRRNFFMKVKQYLYFVGRINLNPAYTLQEKGQPYNMFQWKRIKIGSKFIIHQVSSYDVNACGDAVVIGHQYTTINMGIIRMCVRNGYLELEFLQHLETAEFAYFINVDHGSGGQQSIEIPDKKPYKFAHFSS